MIESSNAITINLGDSQDVASLESENIIQRRALHDIAKLLQEHLNKRKQAITKPYANRGNLFLYPRSHDTISIQGGRGSGKTTFIRNLLCWLDGAQNPPRELEELVPEFIPLGVLDPTLIENKENIFVLILNAVKQRVDKQLHNNYHDLDTYDSHDYQSWLQSLKDLARGLSLLDDIGGKDGMGDEWEDPNYILEKGLTDARSSTKLERNFHVFIEKSIQLIDGANSTSSFILAIDDIDTDFSRGWPVLEVLRRYLTSDRLVIILSGDMELYALLLRNQLWNNFNSNFLNYDPVAKHNEKNKPEKPHNRGSSTADMVTHIQSQYLLKILKPTKRVELRSLQDTLHDPTVGAIKIASPTLKKSTDIREILERFTRSYLYFKRKNDKALINELILRQPTRTVIQFLSLIVAEESPENGDSRVHLNQLHMLSSSFIDVLSNLSVNLEGLRSITDDRVIFTIISFLLNNDAWTNHSDLHPNDNHDDINLALLILNAYAASVMNSSPSLFFKYTMKVFIPELAVTRKFTNQIIKDIADFLQLDKIESISRTSGRLTSVMAPRLIESKEKKGNTATSRSTCMQNGIIRIKRDVRDAKSIYNFYPISSPKNEPQSAENAEKALLERNLKNSFIEGWKPYYEKVNDAISKADTELTGKVQLKGVWYNLVDHFKVPFWSDVAKIPINDNIVIHGTRTRCFNILNILAFMSDILGLDITLEAKSQTLNSIFNRHSQIKGYPTATRDIEFSSHDEGEPDEPTNDQSPSREGGDQNPHSRDKILKALEDWAHNLNEKDDLISTSLRAQRKIWEFFLETVNAMEHNNDIKRMGFGHLVHRVIIAFFNSVLVNGMIDSGEFEDARLVKPITEDNVFLSNLKQYKKSSHSIAIFDLMFSFPIWGAFLDTGQKSYTEWVQEQNLDESDFKFKMTLPRFNQEIELNNLFELFNSIPVTNIE